MANAEAWNIELVGQTDLNGHGDCMHVNVRDGFAYVGHMGDDEVGTSVVDVSDPSAPRVLTQIERPPGTHTHKVQLVEDLLLVNCELNPTEKKTASRWQAGLKVFDVSTPDRPVEIGFMPMGGGKGVHRMTCTELPYVYMSGSDEGFTDQFFMIADLSDPTNPVEVGRWWYPGMNVGAGETPDPGGRWLKHHHPLLRGDRAYAPWWDAGLVILDIADLERPSPVGFLEFPAEESRFTHTALPLPGRDVLVVTDETMPHRDGGMQKHVRLVDIADETAPRVISKLPIPQGDYGARPGRFGPHNLHEMRPGTFQSSSIVHLTYFNAGLRIYDVSDAADPREIAYFVPPPHAGAEAIQLNDLTVTADGMIYVTDRAAGGLYILRADLPTA